MKRKVLYFAGVTIFIAAGLLLQSFYSKETLFEFLSVKHSFLLNVFFINYTFLGDGVFALCLPALLYFYFKRKKQGLLLFLTILSTGLVVQLLKNISVWPAVQFLIEPGRYDYIINTTVAQNLPSSHTAIVFATAAVIVLTEKSRKLQLPLLCAAVLVAYSRIYLAPQLIEDVIAGAFTGTAAAIFSYYAYNLKTILPKFKKALYKKTYAAANDTALQPG